MARKIPATRTLSELGYELLHDRVYKATWSSPDVEHFSISGWWAITNGAIRAGQIVALANKCGMPTAQIRATLEARERWIANGFLKSSPMRKNPSDYIDRIIADWPARAGTET